MVTRIEPAMGRMVSAQKNGFQIHHWFALSSGSGGSGPQRAATGALLAELRWLGVPVPPLTWLHGSDYSPVARAIVEAREQGFESFVTGITSPCVRVAAAAIENYLDLSGTRFWAGGEAITKAKAEVFHRAGAEIYASYGAQELGMLFQGCPHYEGQNTVHCFRDAVAVVTRVQEAPGTGSEVNSLMLTPLLASAAFLVINLDVGDHGVLQKARCGCRISQLGLDTVISDIYSYTRLTGHHTVISGADIVRIMEQALPARFGGSLGDYQLAEQEAAGAQTHFVLRVNPRAVRAPLDQIRSGVLEEVSKVFGGSYHVSMWNQAGALEVKAEPPLSGETGKVPAFIPLGLRERREDA